MRLEVWRCQACSFAFLANPPSLDYDVAYLEEQELLSTGAVPEQLHIRERLAHIATVVPPASGARLLDVGIGDGTFLKAAEQAGYITAGLDINIEGVELARKKYGLRAEMCVDPLPVAFAGSQFDVIHLNEVIEHLSRPSEMLAWCRQHIEPRGVLVVQTGNIDSLVSRIKGDAWDYIRPWHVGYFSPPSMRFALHQANFRLERQSVVDWRVTSVLSATSLMAAESSRSRALKWLAFALSCKLPGIRRTLLVRARPV